MVELLEKLPMYIELAVHVIAAASVIAALTPTPKDDSVVSKVRAVVDLLAFNFGNAKNARKF